MCVHRCGILYAWFRLSHLNHILNTLCDCGQKMKLVVLALTLCVCVCVCVCTHTDSPSSQNVLDDRLKHTNSGVVLGTISLFLHLTQDLPDLHQDVYDRIHSEPSTLSHHTHITAPLHTYHTLHSHTHTRACTFPRSDNQFVVCCGPTHPSYFAIT